MTKRVMKMEKCKHKNDVHRYADGELKHADAGEFELHLKECELCKATLEDIGKLKSIFSGGDLTDLPLGFEERLLRKAGSRKVRQRRLLFPPALGMQKRKWFAVAASMAILILAGLHFVLPYTHLMQSGGVRGEVHKMAVEPGAEGRRDKGLVYLFAGGAARSDVYSTGYAEPMGNSLSVGGNSIPNDKSYDATFFENYGVNPFISTEDEKFSTFGMDVDTASYTIARRFIRDGFIPEKDAIRTEEFINYFDQDYPNAEGVFSIYTEGARSEFGKPNYHLLKIGIRANEVSFEDRKAANMVFVVDVSGSMAREDRLEQVKRSLRKLSEHLKEGDRVGLVVYGSEGRVISDLTSRKKEIFNAIDKLVPDGSTNAEEGLRLAYKMARRNFEKGKINRIILCSDGVANVGVTGADEILKQVKEDAEKGITLTTIGFGMGNYNDVLMEKLANHGDGNYYYIDSDDEADRLFGNGAVSMLQVLASDAKIQVEFNPDTVDRYRLLGYENRRLNKEDFEDDAVDAGEVGAGQTVTALYELRIKDEEAAKPDAEIATVRIRYMDTDSERIRTNERKVRSRDVVRKFESASSQFRFTAAVAEFAELLKESYWAKDGSYERVLKVAKDAVGLISDVKEREFIELVKEARDIKKADKEMSGAGYERPRPVRADECKAVYRLSADPMIISMADGIHYISTEIAVCVDASKVSEDEFKRKTPQIKTVVDDTLSRISKDDIMRSENSSSFAKNIEHSRRSLLLRLSEKFPWIKDIYIISFLVN